MHEEIVFGGGPPGSRIGELPRTDEEFRKLFKEQIDATPEWVKLLERKSVEMCATPEGKAMYGDPERGVAYRKPGGQIGTCTDSLRVFSLPAALPHPPRASTRSA